MKFFYWITLTSSVLLAIAGFVPPTRLWIEDHSPIQYDPAGVAAVFVTLAGCWIIDLNKREHQLKDLPGWMYKLAWVWVISCGVIWFAFQIKYSFWDVRRIVFVAFLVGCFAAEIARPKRPTTNRPHEFY